MIYKGYEGVLEVDEEAGELFGTVRGLGRDGITFVGATVEEARESFERSVDFYLERCAATGKEPERPYSGNLLVRVSPETHRELERIADIRHAGLDVVVGEALATFVERPPPAAAPMDPAGGGPVAAPGGPARRRGKRA